MEFVNRWWTYQKVRFPIFAYLAMIAAFSFSTLSFSIMLRDRAELPHWSAILVAFVSCLFFFLQLRIADEFKDHEEDKQYRPYLPVPQGIVTLPELRNLFILTALVQLGLSLWLAPKMIVLLLIVWTYLWLMAKEFFVRDWLKARPFTYMWTHMFIMPCIDLYAASCDWMVKGKGFPEGFLAFIAASFFNGMVIEIGRKLRAPEDEEEGVQTYTACWGLEKATFSWLLVNFLAGLFATWAASLLHCALPVGIVLGMVFLFSCGLAFRFLKAPAKKWGKMIELHSGIWTLIMYLALGILPRFFSL